MKNLSIAFLAAVSLASLAGCPKKEAGAKESIAKMSDFKDRMCKCTDKACADKVNEDMAKWGQENAKHIDKAPAVSEDDTKLLTDITKQLTECQAKVIGGPGAKPADPTAPPATDGSGAKPADGSAAAPANGSAAPANGSAAPAATDGSAAAPANGSAAAPANGSADGSAAAPANGSAAGSSK